MAKANYAIGASKLCGDLIPILFSDTIGTRTDTSQYHPDIFIYRPSCIGRVPLLITSSWMAVLSLVGLTAISSNSDDPVSESRISFLLLLFHICCQVWVIVLICALFFSVSVGMAPITYLYTSEVSTHYTWERASYFHLNFCRF